MNIPVFISVLIMGSAAFFRPAAQPIVPVFPVDPETKKDFLPGNR